MTIPDIGRLAFLGQLAEAILAASRQQADMALVYFRVVNLSRIQYRLGYRGTDRLLEAVRRQLSEITRPQDVMACVGEGDFALVVTALRGEGHAILAANKVQRCFAEPLMVGDKPTAVRLVAGISLLSVQAADAEGMLLQAELALGEAEQANHDYAIFTPMGQERREQDWELDESIGRAIENGELMLVFQPKIDLITREPTGFQALTQWLAPERGLVQPDELWDIGRRTGTLPALTWWGLQTLMRTARGWPEAWNGLALSLRIPRSVLQDRDLVPQITNAVNFWGIAPDCLGLDLSEDLVCGLTRENRAILYELQEMGVSIAIAGFGAGCSSLGSLSRLPASELKISPRFVRGMLENEADLHVVQTIIQIGRNFGLAVCAEGVDSPETSDALRELGCDYGSGEQIVAPMDERELTAWLARPVGEA